MACHRCEADRQPPGFGDPRKCAFLDDGTFTPENWNCATLEALTGEDSSERPWPQWRTTEVNGMDESLQVVAGSDYGGFLVLTRYKHRGRTSSAVHVGDFWPARPLTLRVAERWLAGTFWEDINGE